MGSTKNKTTAGVGLGVALTLLAFGSQPLAAKTVRAWPQASHNEQGRATPMTGRTQNPATGLIGPSSSSPVGPDIRRLLMAPPIEPGKALQPPPDLAAAVPTHTAWQPLDPGSVLVTPPGGPVPTPGTLAVLALGMTLARRRRR